MTTGKKVINTLKSHVGDGGSFVWKWYGGGTGWAWCNATVCWAFNKAGASKLFYGGKKVSYCPTSIKWCQQNLAQIPLELADAGDIIYFDWDKNGNPNHIGFVYERINSSSVKTIEGNAGSPSRVRILTRPSKYVQAVFRPHYTIAKPDKLTLKIDGKVQQKSIYSFQFVLGIPTNGILDKTTVKAIQKLVGASQDGAWGKETSKALQKMLRVAEDGDFGTNSQMALQAWINAHLEKKPTPKADRIVALATEYAYVYGTASSRCGYAKGSAKESYKKALDKAYPDRSGWGKATRLGASCDVFVGTVVRNAGIDPKFSRGLGTDKQGQWHDLANKDNWQEVKLTEVKAGDIIIYKKSGGGGHVCICLGDRIAEAGHENYYPVVKGLTKTRTSTSGKSKIKAFRVKEDY